MMREMMVSDTYFIGYIDIKRIVRTPDAEKVSIKTAALWTSPFDGCFENRKERSDFCGLLWIDPCHLPPWEKLPKANPFTHPIGGLVQSFCARGHHCTPIHIPLPARPEPRNSPPPPRKIRNHLLRSRRTSRKESPTPHTD